MTSAESPQSGKDILVAVNLWEFIDSFDSNSVDPEVMKVVREGMVHLAQTHMDEALLEIATTGSDGDVVAALREIVADFEESVFTTEKEELKIRDPCADCKLRHLCETREGRATIVAAGMMMSLAGIETFEGCKHPWRLLNVVYGLNPDEHQKEVMSGVVKVRRKDPAEYGLPE